MASGVYYVSSTLFPAKETYLDQAILPDDEVLDSANDSKLSDDPESSFVEKGSVHADVKSVEH